MLRDKIRLGLIYLCFTSVIYLLAPSQPWSSPWLGDGSAGKQPFVTQTHLFRAALKGLAGFQFAPLAARALLVAL